MASADSKFDFIPHKITKGPARIDILETLFFDQEKILDFVLDNKKQLIVRLLGVIHCDHRQVLTLIVSHFASHDDANHGKSTMLMMVYDTYNRNGKLVDPKTIPELLNQNWY